MIQTTYAVTVATVFVLMGDILFVDDDRRDDDQDKAVPVLPKDTLPTGVDLNAIPDGLGLDRNHSLDNPLTESRVALGRKLFFDPILSHDGTVSCASCHQPEHGMASPDPKAIGIGGQVGKRNAPSIFNRAYGTVFFWDGRATTMEEQALIPISDKTELGGDVDSIVEVLKASEKYPDLFQEAFGDEGSSTDAKSYVTKENLGKAIAGFQRTLLIGDSLVDQFHGGDYAAISDSARQGLWIFQSSAKCWKCHSGDNFSDETFHNTGVSFDLPGRDVGRFEVTNDEKDRFSFKTPTLRGVANTAPYMHDGSVATLKEVVEFYNRGGAPDDSGLDKELKPLNLTELEVDHLVEFLKALSQSK